MQCLYILLTPESVQYCVGFFSILPLFHGTVFFFLALALSLFSLRSGHFTMDLGTYHLSFFDVSILSFSIDSLESWAKTNAETEFNWQMSLTSKKQKEREISGNNKRYDRGWLFWNGKLEWSQSHVERWWHWALLMWLLRLASLLGDVLWQFTGRWRDGAVAVLSGLLLIKSIE